MGKKTDISKWGKKWVKEYFKPKPSAVKKSVVQKVHTYLKEHGSIDRDDLAYFPDKFDFTKAQFQELFRGLEAKVGDRVDDYMLPKSYFPEWKIQFYFEDLDIKIGWRMLIGQGSAEQLYLPTEKEWKPKKAVTISCDKRKKKDKK